MALNLLKNKKSVVAFDVNESALETLSAAGAEICSSPMELAAKCKEIVTMLPNVSHVQDVYLGEKGILKAVQPNTLLIDSSTIDPSVSKEVSKMSQQNGAVYMDAPVSGGVPAAAAGTLTFMVGGPKKTYEQTERILEMMGQRIVHCGDVGTGQAAKLCNNMLLATSMIATAESMNLGIKLGLDPKLLADIMGSSSGRCWSVDTYNPVPGVIEGVPSSKEYNGGFASALMLKDLLLCEQAASASGATIDAAKHSISIYKKLCDTDNKFKDFSSVYQFIKMKA